MSIGNSVENINKGSEKDWKPFVRQLVVCSGPWTVFFMLGLCTGYPTVLVPQLRKANVTISDETASWLPGLFIYSGIPWIFILPTLSMYIGWKKSHIIVCINSLIGFSILFLSKTITQFLTCNFFLGTMASSFFTSCMAILTEFTSSKHRGIFLVIKSATFFWGILVANAIGTFFHWQNIAILGLVCSVYTLINVVIWPESPLWLAGKGRFEECAAAHRWLKGNNEESEKELDRLLKSHEIIINVKQRRNLRKTIKRISKKQFLKPILLCYLLACLYFFSGKLVCTVFALDILKKMMFGDTSAYSGMLILDSVTVLSMYIGCFIARVLKRRLMLIGFSLAGIMFMISISVYQYMIKLSLLEDNKYIALILLVGYSISVSCGPMIMSTSIMGELIPIELRTISMCIIALTFKITNGTLVKLSPLCFRALQIHGTFALYAILSSIILIMLYFYLPETSNRTIQDINDTIRNNDRKGVTETAQLMNIK